MRFGIIWRLIPIYSDLLISTAVVTAGGSVQEAVAPHNLFTVLALAVARLGVWKRRWSVGVGGGPVRIALGMLIQIALDFPHKDGVSFLWPLTAQRSWVRPFGS